MSVLCVSSHPTDALRQAIRAALAQQPKYQRMVRQIGLVAIGAKPAYYDSLPPPVVDPGDGIIDVLFAACRTSGLKVETWSSMNNGVVVTNVVIAPTAERVRRVRRCIDNMCDPRANWTQTSRAVLRLGALLGYPCSGSRAFLDRDLTPTADRETLRHILTSDERLFLICSLSPDEAGITEGMAYVRRLQSAFNDAFGDLVPA